MTGGAATVFWRPFFVSGLASLRLLLDVYCLAPRRRNRSVILKAIKPLQSLLLLLLTSTIVLPDPAMPLGDVLTTDRNVICVGYTKTVRDVPQSLKNQVYRQYGVVAREPREYEIDHLISLELGDSGKNPNKAYNQTANKEHCR